VSIHCQCVDSSFGIMVIGCSPPSRQHTCCSLGCVLPGVYCIVFYKTREYDDDIRVQRRGKLVLRSIYHQHAALCLPAANNNRNYWKHLEFLRHESAFKSQQRYVLLFENSSGLGYAFIDLLASSKVDTKSKTGSSGSSNFG
jgi:hypothetical protein